MVKVTMKVSALPVKVASQHFFNRSTSVLTWASSVRDLELSALDFCLNPVVGRTEISQKSLSTIAVVVFDVSFMLQKCRITDARLAFFSDFNLSTGDAVINGAPGEVLEGFTLNNKHLTDEGVLDCILGLAQCSWPGRNQKLEKPGITYYLDGAHTVESIQLINQLS
ncbi:hypothetical protein KUTeg_018722 [Tegillarca granosa]|uniref:Folylpolyglutamate synthase n=1 Tax=Tegillarca granosa TaxID=220873 RepID=A0ABQ9EEN1_TEGGR|nr:hypothetical protein KUTeg_018722 [Tegillarca granosa]